MNSATRKFTLPLFLLSHNISRGGWQPRKERVLAAIDQMLPQANDRTVDNYFCSFIGYPATLGYVEEPHGGMTPVMVMWAFSNSSAALSKINLASK